jgi:hypothetical protein
VSVPIGFLIANLWKKDLCMSLAKNASLAAIKNASFAAIMIIAGTMLAYGNSSPQAEQVASRDFRPSNDNDAVSIDRITATGLKGVVFRSALQYVTKDSGDAAVAEWNNSLRAERSRDEAQTSPVTLPEPRTGILLGIGLLAMTQLWWRNGNQHSRPRNTDIGPYSYLLDFFASSGID